MNANLWKEFAAPPSPYRGKPFWAWNGKLEPAELRRQIRVMKRMGLGGFFMHSRVGLDTAYLSDDWFRCVDACIDEAAKQKMEAWIYDEDRWPSGAAGGLVTKNPRFRMRHLHLEVLDAPAKLKRGPGLLAVFAARLNQNRASKVRRLAPGERPRLVRGEKLLAFRVQTEGTSDWYNGQTYLDTMNHAAVREFIKVTHERYRRRCGKHFGRTVPGIFTDEPNFGNNLSSWGASEPPVISWTAQLPAVFKRRYGYDVIEHLPELFYDVEGRTPSRARYHYHDCTTHLFVDAFARQIGEWCGKNRQLFTGHVLCEETLSSQTHVVGSCMRSYEYMQAPGMDLLTEHNREYETAKQVSSAARQFGWKWRLTETYGCTGWDFPFLGHKALGDWQLALGINLRAQHLSWYTMLGEAKRDYPAGIFFHSPWWEIYPKVEDYFARLHAVMTRGVEVRDLLVVHPVESMWLLWRLGHSKDPAVGKLNRMIVALRDALLAANLDFDYGDEELLSRHARVTREDGRPILRVGKAVYKAVVVPPLLTIRGTTLKLLRRFQAAGGRVIFAGKVPGLVDAAKSREAVRLAKTCRRAPPSGPGLPAAVQKSCRRVSIADARGREIIPVLHLLREDRDAFYLFVCNTSLKPGQLKPVIWSKTLARDRREAFPDVRIRGFADCAGRPLELDPDRGKVYAAAARASSRGWEIRTALPALGSRLFVIPKQKGGKLPPPRPRYRDVRAQSLGAARWRIALSECNNLVLDRPQYRIGEGKWQGPDEILRVDGAVREILGVRRRGGGMKQPWAREKLAHPKRVPVTLRYGFTAEALPSGDLFLALEKPEAFRVEVNGVPLSMDAECGWWVDGSLRKIPVDPALIRLGRNEIVMHCDFREDFSGLEIAYLLGNFGARADGAEAVLTRPPEALRVGDWVKQGLAFYSGSVGYCRTIKPKLRKGQRLFVQVPAYRGAAVRVTVNGKAAGVIAWEPNEVDITECLDGGPAELRIEVVSHRRNSHGPLHLTEKWPSWTGPGEFVASGKRWQDEYQLVPCGLMAAPKLVVRR